jgi:MFS family permease
MIGSQLWGILADVYGRKRVLVLVSSMNAVFSLLAAFAPYFVWMVILRVLGGFSVSAADIIITYMVEILPQRYRGNSVLLLEIFFAGGGILVVAIGLFMVPTVGWNWYLFVSAMPAFLCALLSVFLPSSPRYLVVKGRRKEAMKVLNKIAKINCKPQLKGRLVTDVYQQKHARTTVTPDDDHLVGFENSRNKGEEDAERVWLLSKEQNDVTASQQSSYNPQDKDEDNQVLACDQFLSF